MNYWFSSDFHLGHANIIKYCDRPFKSLKQMNETLIKRFNERVNPEDLVFFLGDFCFKNSKNSVHRGEGDIHNANYYKEKLNCKNIVFIKGNHDRNNSLKTPIERLVIRLGGKRINLVHNPAHADLNYEINFVGHVHNLFEIKRIKKGLGYTDLINVSVDVWNFYPASFEEIMKKYYQWKKNA